jgi:hypothetical protein
MSNQAKQQLAVWWVTWLAFQTGIFFFYHFLGSTGTLPPSSAALSSIWLVALFPVVLSAIVRWLILPRALTARAALPLFIIGITMAEATCFLGLFIFPAHKQELCLLSAIGIFQFIPVFAVRYFQD